jgi:hypothetical protein
VAMSKAIKIVKYFLIFFLIAMITACSSTKKNPYYQKRKKASKVNTEQLGRNRYFFSPGYQKKLYKSYKKK